MAFVISRIRWLAGLLVLLPTLSGAAALDQNIGIGGPIDAPRPITPISPYKPVLPGITTLESRLGFSIMHPLLVFNNTGTLVYMPGASANGGVMLINADPLAIQLTPGTIPFSVLPFAGNDFLSLSLIIDETTGLFVEGIPGEDFLIVGQADTDNNGIPDVAGVLLTGEVIEYMSEDSGGTTDFHYFRIQVTGGELAGFYPAGQIGINLTSEMSNFTGSFQVPFDGEAKGTLGKVDCTGTIGDFVWSDTNGNGIQDPGEPGIPDVELILVDPLGMTSTTTTDGTGFYQFTDLCSGDYIVSVNPATVPPGFDPTLINAPGSTPDNDSDDPAGVTVTLDENDSSDQTIDFGYVTQPAALGDFVWLDTDMDGFQDPDEPGIEGVMVNLYACDGTFIGTMVTDINGFYFFNNLMPGCYQVEFILPPGLVFSPMDAANDAFDSDPDPTTGFTAPVNLAPGEVNPNVDAGMFPPPSAELGDRFWLDENGNGIQDPGEPGIPGVPVDLIDCATGAVLDSTTTDANGMYLFGDLDAGCYQVQFTPPQDCVLTLQDEGADDAADSDADPASGITDAVFLDDDESNLTVDGGCYFTAGLGDFVWLDSDMDGFQDPGEPGIPGLTVVLLDGDMVPTGMSTITGPAGEYQFLDLAPGSYFVQFTAPAGFVFTAQDAAADDVDSDANGVGKTDKITLSSGEFNPTIDAGVFEPPMPAISIEKSTNGDDADVPTGPFVPNGGDVLWEYVVTNTGNTTLFDILVTDNQGVLVTCPDDTLVPGDSFICTGNGTGTVDQYMNIGAVCGTDGNMEVCDDDPSHYFGSDPSIDIEKATNGQDADDPTGPFITPGAAVTWTYVVTNTGNVLLTNVVVNDDQGVTVTCPLDNLQPGQIMTCIGNGTAVAGQYANNSTVTGEPPVGDPVDDEDPSHYFGALPDIDIEKATNGEDADHPTGPFIAVGGNVNWTYLVTNTGNVDLINVVVTDSEGAVVNCPADTLAVGDSFTCTASGIATVGQYFNLGTVTGDPPVGPPVDDDDPSHYFGALPEIDLEKLTEGEDADDPTGPFITPGDPVTWTYVITNMGNVPLDNIVLNDDQLGPITCDEGPIPALDVGDNFICTVMGIAVAGQYMNIGDVCGTATFDDGSSSEVCDDDPSHYFGAEPDIDIEKATNGEDADSPTGPSIPAGGDVEWTYVVTNTGNVDLSNVVVTDSQGVVVNCPADTLVAGDSFTCTGSGTAIPGQYANIGSVCGNDERGTEVCDDDPSHYFGADPDIDLEKLTQGEDADNPTGPFITPGDTVTWTYIITNMGNVALDNIVLNDSQLGPITCNEGPIPALGVGDSFVCTVMGIAIAGQYMNLGDVCGTDDNGTEVCDEDPSHYFGADPDIDIEKATNGEDADDPTGPFIETGGAVNWTYVVTNTGNVPLSNVTVTDNQGVVVTCPQDTLIPGEDMTCTANGIATPGQYANIGDVVGTPPEGPPVTDEDPSHYFGTTPDIDVEKLTNGVNADDPNAGDAPQILPGDPVNWTYVVTNTGNVPLSGVTVADNQGVAVTCPASTLNPGDSFTCTASGVADDLATTGFTTVLGLCGIRPNVPLYENTGIAVGVSPLGTIVRDEDLSHYCNPEPCALEVSKTCFIPMPAPSEYVCDTPIDSLTMIWDGASPVRIKAYKGPVGSELLADIDDILPGEEITVMGYAGSPNDVFWEVFTGGTSSKIGESKFHLSCSDDEMDGPEDCGLNEGNGKGNDAGFINNWLLEGIVDAGGTLDCTVPPTTGDQTECEFQAFPASCETGNADFLTLQYTGGGCGAADNSQGSYTCSGSIDGGDAVTLTDDGGNVYTLNPGDTVTMARNLAKNLALTNAGGTETNVLHTSCSQPLAAGDVYGSLTLVQIDGMGIGTDVNYSYVITNTSNVDIVSLSAVDVPLGPIPGAPSSLGAGASVTLNASAFITETTTNTAIVDGLTSDGQMCNDSASATVTILPPPPCDVDGSGVLDLSSDKIKWELTNNGAFTATIESVEITWPTANGGILEVKLDGDRIYETLTPPNSVTLGPNDWIGDLNKRQIPPGDTDILEIKFENDVAGPQDAYSITVNFEEGCSVTFVNTGLPFECTDKIIELNMSWDGAADPVRVKAYKGSVGSELLLDQSGIGVGDEISVTGLSGAPNDVFWEVFSGGTKIGESNFHLSCSDNEMNGAEDCGNRQGNGKGNDSGLINDWILEGLTDGDGPFDCDNLP